MTKLARVAIEHRLPRASTSAAKAVLDEQLDAGLKPCSTLEQNRAPHAGLKTCSTLEQNRPPHAGLKPCSTLEQDPSLMQGLDQMQDDNLDQEQDDKFG